MLNINNRVITNDMTAQGQLGRFVKAKNLMDLKTANYLQLTATKNAVNRACDWHYLAMCVTNSTAPVNDIDYIHPVVKPSCDYATAVMVKGVAPNGEIDFEFVPDNEDDATAARQATDMVSRIVNSQNQPHAVLQEWILDACLHKNGMLMVKPVRKLSTRYVTTVGTQDQLSAFEAQAEEAGLTPLRQSRRKTRIDMEKVQAEMQQFKMAAGEAQAELDMTAELEAMQLSIDNEDIDMEVPNVEMQDGESELAAAVDRNTIYEAKYKLSGYETTIQWRHVSQHYWVCDPNVTSIQEQPFCGFYESMTIQQATEVYPGINIDEFRDHSSFNQNAAFQSGSILNNLAIHARDSAPMAGIPVNSGQSADPYSMRVTVLTVWDRYDIDDDGELELIEIVYSGDYIISAKEVEFIPIANLCPKPLPGNFFGYSIAESVVPMQEYATAGHRAEILLGLAQATTRIGVKPDRVDFQSFQDGENAVFMLDSKFDPATDVYPVPPPAGNIGFMDAAMNRMQQDTMAMVGMTQPNDVFNPEVMAPGNSGIKLQMALSPNQIIQDNTVKNAAEGVKEALWLTWRTLIQYADDYGVKKLAQLYHPDKKPEFLDAMAFDDFNFCDRKHMNISLALGMMSEENAIGRIEIIKKTQQEMYTMVQAMAMQGTLTPEVYKKMKKPYADTLYNLGVKDCDTYLPNDEEIGQMIKQGMETMKQKGPAPVDQLQMAMAEYNKARVAETAAKTDETKAKTQEILASITGASAERQLEAASLMIGKPRNFNEN
jgi:hypothetical protein